MRGFRGFWCGLLVALGLLMALPAAALQTSWYPTYFASNPSTSATNYLNFANQLGSWNATEANMGNCLGSSATVDFSAWTISVTTAPGMGKSYLFTLRDNGVDTGMAVQIADTATSGTYGGAAVTVSPGHVLTVSCVPTGTPAATGKMAWRFKQVGVGQPIFTSVTGATSLNAGQTRFIAPQGGGIASDECAEPRPMPSSGTISNLYVKLSADPGGAAQSVAVTFRQNAFTAPATYASPSDTTLTCTISTGNTSGSDTTHSISVNQGDIIDFKLVSSASAATTKVFIGYTFTPSNAGEMVVLGEIYGTASTTKYNFGAGSVDGTEANVQTPFPACTLKNFFAKVSNSAGTYTNLISTMTCTWRKAGAAAGSPSSLSFPADGSSQTWSDMTDTITVADGDLIDVQNVSGANTAGFVAHYGLTLVIAQPNTLFRRSITNPRAGSRGAGLTPWPPSLVCFTSFAGKGEKRCSGYRLRMER